MKVSLSKIKTFGAPVSVKIPNERGGFDTQKFGARFQVLSSDEQKDIRAAATDAGLDPEREVLRRAWTGWDHDLIDEDTDQPLVYTDETRDALLAVPYITIAIAQAYWPSLSNGTARRKN